MPTPAPTSASPVAARILDAAVRRFAADGIRTVSADRVIAEAGVSKVTFYRHFPTKDALVVAYLTAVAEAERAAVDEYRAAHPGDARAVLDAYADVLGGAACLPGFRGCPFINAAAEYADPGHPVRAVVAEHRRWMVSTATELLTALGVPGAAAAAEELVMLRDGAMVAGYVGGPDTGEAVAGHLRRAGAAIVAAHRPPAS
ncbi:TetR/AcrR family transcriptional regulator [Cellulomonas sp. C5510]|uniref:TetR/AcrR family transcriptional regulator n=1 Tax=Cellulomonas sp. C5510 TaxID=2871170 RepID=UPI001C93C827|nr:TetR/AcrR family transcriptional regulator [Cellulomonas sp. C5510]QZN85847.1 TetR/AcrR family transcriptional regulator [Cellulomonas sp. C5510]